MNYKQNRNKRSFTYVFLAGIMIATSMFFLPITSWSQDAQAIVKKADEHMRGNTTVVELTIQTIRPTWSRSLELKAWMKGADYSMILIQSPAKEKGIVFLKRRKEVWNWMPVLERNIKLPPSMMSQSWMGTDFTNDDLVRESSVVRDYSILWRIRKALRVGDN